MKTDLCSVLFRDRRTACSGTLCFKFLIIFSLQKARILHVQSVCFHNGTPKIFCQWLLQSKMFQMLPRGLLASVHIPLLQEEHKVFLTHCGRLTQICVFNTVKLGTSESSPQCLSTRRNVSRGITTSSTTRVFGEYFLKISVYKSSQRICYKFLKKHSIKVY